MADICTELRKQLHELDVLRESCGSLLLREGIESDTAKETVRKFDALAEELHDAVALYKQPFSERLDNIERKMEDKKNLTKWECRVLYGINLHLNGIDLHLKGSSYEEKKRRQDMVEKWRSDEEKKRDLALALDIIPDRISVTEEEALSGNIRYHYDDLNLGGLTSINIKTEITMPEEVSGNLNLFFLKSIDTNFTFPENIDGYLSLHKLTSIDTEITMPEEVGGELDLESLTSIKTKLTMPKKIGDYLSLHSLTSIDTDLTMPEVVGGDLYLNNLTSTQGITNWPVKIIGTVHVNQALPDNEKAALEKRYPGKIRQV